MTTHIHKTAIIDEPVSIGENTRIWHFCHLMKGCTIGRDCTLGQNVYVGGQVTVGKGVKIQNNVSLYDGVHIEDNVFIGPSAVFTNVTNPRAHRNQRDSFIQTTVKQGATIGANATIVCGVTIGAYAFVGAGAVVTKDVPDHALMLGVPAIHQGWVCDCGERIDPSVSCNVCGWTR
ncbi:MAG: N-acetyltransferase [Deltaproteobacteria bacterium]|nr:N-acetyltransferase [Deltaproteobacteria bacterium]MBN2670839.1 N-acetyltransferase [Deltaproteobacteria bacterium]